MISGTARGHKLKTPKGYSTRPTSDKIKGSMFNILAGSIIDTEVLDLYSGTGSLGIEALSRGAKFAVFVDKSQWCGKIIKENLEHTKLISLGEILTCQVTTAIKKLKAEHRSFDIVFLDPPYDENILERTLIEVVENDIIKDKGIIIAEHDTRYTLPEKIGGLNFVEKREYGGTALSFYLMGR